MIANGTKVRVVLPGHMTDGKTGAVVHAMKTNGWYWVQLDHEDSGPRTYSAKTLAVIDAGSRVSTPGGHIGTVLRFNGFYRGGVWVDCDDGTRRHFFLSDLVPLDDVDWSIINPEAFETATGALR